MNTNSDCIPRAEKIPGSQRRPSVLGAKVNEDGSELAADVSLLQRCQAGEGPMALSSHPKLFA
jgi:hypothetical protein